MAKVICKSGLCGWRMKLKKSYASFQEFVDYNKIYGLAKRLGYGSAKAAWAANPTIEGSIDPSDFRRAPTTKSKSRYGRK